MCHGKLKPKLVNKCVGFTQLKHLFFHPTTVLFLQIFYEFGEDKKPECGVEMVRLALEYLGFPLMPTLPCCSSLISLKSSIITKMAKLVLAVLKVQK